MTTKPKTRVRTNPLHAFLLGETTRTSIGKGMRIQHAFIEKYGNLVRQTMNKVPKEFQDFFLNMIRCDPYEHWGVYCDPSETDDKSSGASEAFADYLLGTDIDSATGEGLKVLERFEESFGELVRRTMEEVPEEFKNDMIRSLTHRANPYLWWGFYKDSKKKRSVL